MKLNRTLPTIQIFPLIRHLFLALFILTVSFTINAQKSGFKFKKLSVKQGLSQSSVFSITQDHNGFMWFGTRTGGLNKFDGYSYTVYKHDPDDSCSLSENEITALYEDSKKNLWVGTRSGGLNRFDASTDCFIRYKYDAEDKNSIVDNTINAIYEDSKGRVWIATNKDLCLYDASIDGFVPYFSPYLGKRSARSKTVTAIIEDKDGLLWLGTKSGMFRLNTETKDLSIYDFKEGDPTAIIGPHITSLTMDQGGQIWIGTRESGICVLLDSEKKIFRQFKYNPNTPSSIASNIIRFVSVDSNGDLWIGSKMGLDQVKADDLQNPKIDFTHYQNNEFDEYSLSQNSLYSFFEDNVGDFWIGTWSGGVNYLNNGNLKFEHYKNQINNDLSLSNNVVSCFVEEGEDVWVGTEGGGLNYFDRSKNVFIRYQHDPEDPTSMISDHVKSLFKDKDGDLWVGTYKGLHLFDRETKTFKLYIKGQSIYSITQGVGNEIWVATNKMLHKLNKTEEGVTFKVYKKESKKDPTGLKNNTINVVYFDALERLWVGTKKGFHLYNRVEDNFIAYLHDESDRNSISNDHITTITEDSNGHIWIGTYDGLNRFNPEENRFALYSEKMGFSDNVVNGMAVDVSGKLWFTSNKGLSKFDLPQFRQLYEEDSMLVKEALVSGNDSLFVIGDNPIIRNYDYTDGLQDDEFTKNAGYVSENGELFFGGINGFNVFDPSEIKINKNIPAVVVTDFRLFNKPVKAKVKGSPLVKNISETEELILNYKQSVFTFSFVALDYSSPEKNEYAYKMIGLEDDWNYVGNKREVSYTGLPAGNYVFHVIASNNDGIWNTEGVKIAVSILPPWWQTTWFKFVVFIILVSGSTAFYKYRTYALKQRQKELETEVMNRTQEVRAQSEELLQQSEELQMQRDYLDANNKIMTEINESMTASINYAQTIQEATLPFIEVFQQNFDEHFILYRPKDIVSGDFYWMAEHNGIVFLSVADCTGHGVPGAFMSMIGSSLLNKIVFEQGVEDTNEILEVLDIEVRKALKQEKTQNDDGMDMVLCAFHKDDDGEIEQVSFTGAKNDLYIRTSDEPLVVEVKGDKRSIGGKGYGSRVKEVKPFTKNTLKVQQGDIFYLITDGILDQNRTDRKRLGKKGFLQVLNEQLSISEPVEHHGAVITQCLDDFQGEEKQRDDITVIAVRV